MTFCGGISRSRNAPRSGKMNAGEHDHPDDRAERDPEQEDLAGRRDAAEQERAGPAQRGRQDLAREPRPEGDECCEECHVGSIARLGFRSCPSPRCADIAAASRLDDAAVIRGRLPQAHLTSPLPRASVAQSHEEAPMPQKAWSDKRERQYEHIKDSYEDRGVERRRGRGARGTHRQQGTRRARRDEGRQEALVVIEIGQ